MQGCVIIPAGAREALEREAALAFPRECCGLLAGREAAVELVVPVPNVAPDPRSRFEMAPTALWAEMSRVRRLGLELIGFYHSHPRTDAVPSAYDLSRAYYPDVVYVIVSVEPKTEIRAYRIDGGRSEEIAVGHAAGPEDER